MEGAVGILAKERYDKCSRQLATKGLSYDGL